MISSHYIVKLRLQLEFYEQNGKSGGFSAWVSVSADCKVDAGIRSHFTWPDSKVLTNPGTVCQYVITPVLDAAFKSGEMQSH